MILTNAMSKVQIKKASMQKMCQAPNQNGQGQFQNSCPARRGQGRGRVRPKGVAPGTSANRPTRGQGRGHGRPVTKNAAAAGVARGVLRGRRLRCLTGARIRPRRGSSEYSD